MFRVERPREGHDNNFFLIRHAAALAVVLTHSFSIVSGRFETEPLVGSMQHSIGNYAVDVFFVLSGFLVTQSFARDRDLLRFVVARVLRIFPALAVAVLASALILGPLVSDLPLREYLEDHRLFAYLAGTLSTSSASFPLPGVFEALPEQGNVNDSLWTLKYELAAYLSLCLAIVLGLRPGRRSFVVIAAAALIVYLFTRVVLPWPGEHAPAASNIVHFLLSFYLGAGAYVYRDRIPLSLGGVALLALAALVTHGTLLRELFEMLTIAYFVLWFAFVPKLGSERLGRLGDFSYGLYIFAFPVQQMIRMAEPQISPLALFICATVVTMPLAILSWRFVERPALTYRDPLVRLLRTRFGSRRGRSAAKQPPASDWQSRARPPASHPTRSGEAGPESGPSRDPAAVHSA